MRIKDLKCKKCHCSDLFFKPKGTQLGIYCAYCGQWIKWANKNERNLFERGYR